MKHFTFVSGANQHGNVLAIVKSAACDNGAIAVRLRRVYSVDRTLRSLNIQQTILLYRR